MKNSKILVIDDDAVMLELVEAMLAQAGYQVQAARSGRQGLEIAEIHNGDVDLLLTDVVMPEMSGEEVALAFRRIYPNAKVLFMSAYMKPAAKWFLETRGEVDFIIKPFTFEKLKGKIKRMLA